MVTSSRNAGSIMTVDECNAIAGIDAHADIHYVALVAGRGKRFGDRKFLAVGSECREMTAYITSFGTVAVRALSGARGRAPMLSS